ncbi:MAG TPA: AlpA family phage regulatory protein [Plasticicumulans sp.]|nr:AlpA family phage regulatory protein [Plasticicumulans sp.]
MCSRYGVSRAWAYEAMNWPVDPLPRPVKLGRKSVWVISEVDAWFQRRAAERGAADARGHEIARKAGMASAAARRARRSTAG